MAEAGLAGRLVRDAGQNAVGVVLGPGLDEAIGRFAPVEAHRAIEGDAVESVLVDIAQEIGRRDRCPLRLQRDSDVARRRLQHDEFGRGSGEGIGTGVLRGEGWCEKGEGSQGESFGHATHLATEDIRSHPR